MGYLLSIQERWPLPQREGQHYEVVKVERPPLERTLRLIRIDAKRQALAQGLIEYTRFKVKGKRVILGECVSVFFERGVR
jgi:hypothetical protein